ncbi:hypothetical protein QA597_03305 [Marinilabiliaceae bacterium ANBcel2]|nr:hypothetical protein [Marinilabiliaceae bacterium ANBcel2]
MKRVLFSLLFISSLAYISASAQCGEEVKRQALDEMGNSQYIRDYSINIEKDDGGGKTGQVKFNVLLNSRNHYRFNVVDGPSNRDKIVMQLYDEDNMLVSNYDGGTHYDSFEFVCRSTKVYSLVFSFRGGGEGCAEAVISLVKQYSEGEMGF